MAIIREWIFLGLTAYAFCVASQAESSPDIKLLASNCPYSFRVQLNLDASTIRSQNQEYVVRLFNGKDAAGKNIQGTGFVIDARRGYVLTAGHVVKKASMGEPILGDLEGRAGEVFPLKLIGSVAEQGVDVALLQFDDPGVYARELSSDKGIDIALEFGTASDAVVLGFPRQSDNKIPASLIHEGVQVVSRGTRPQIAGAVIEGESGSPVFDSNGLVFGILIQSITDAAGVVINLYEARELLQIVFHDFPLSALATRVADSLENGEYADASGVQPNSQAIQT